MIWFTDFNHIYIYIFIYLIKTNVNHENSINEFSKSVYYIIGFRMMCFLFKVFLLEKLNKYRFIFNNCFLFYLIFIKRKKSYLIIIRETKKSI